MRPAWPGQTQACAGHAVGEARKGKLEPGFARLEMRGDRDCSDMHVRSGTGKRVPRAAVATKGRRVAGFVPSRLPSRLPSKVDALFAFVIRAVRRLLKLPGPRNDIRTARPWSWPALFHGVDHIRRARARHRFGPHPARLVRIDLIVYRASCMGGGLPGHSRSTCSAALLGRHGRLSQTYYIGAAGASAAGDCRLQAGDVLCWQDSTQYISVPGGIPRCRRSAC